MPMEVNKTVLNKILGLLEEARTTCQNFDVPPVESPAPKEAVEKKRTYPKKQLKA